MDTTSEFFKIYHELCEKNLLDSMSINIGDYEGKDFIIFDSHEDIESFEALLNGYRGKVEFTSLYRDQDLNDEYNKAELELEKTLLENPSHLGTISRLQSRMTKLMNLSAYKRWLNDNEIEPKSLDDFGLEYGFSDEHDLCCDCYQNVVRTSPDSYDWTSPLFIDCEGWVCSDCAGNHKDYVLEEYKNVAKSIPDDFNIADLGLVQINTESYENGLHYGQDDSPKPIIEKLNDAGIDVWFKVYPSQFSCEFDVYVKLENEEQAKEILSNTDTYQGFSSAANCEKALRQASLQSSSLQGEGIKYSKIDVSTGMAETKLVSREEFVKGVK
jgi:hypothetical protein